MFQYLCKIIICGHSQPRPGVNIFKLGDKSEGLLIIWLMIRISKFNYKIEKCDRPWSKLRVDFFYMKDTY